MINDIIKLLLVCSLSILTSSCGSVLKTMSDFGSMTIRTHEPGYLIEVNGNIVGTSPVVITKRRSSLNINAIPSAQLKNNASRIGAVPMGARKFLSVGNASSVYLDTWFADKKKLEERRKKEQIIRIYNH